MAAVCLGKLRMCVPACVFNRNAGEPESEPEPESDCLCVVVVVVEFPASEGRVSICGSCAWCG
jgi:hypothetical protein